MINITRKQRFLFSILSGILMVISFPFTGSLTPLIFISWVPLLLVEESISKNNFRSGKVFIHAYVTFLIYNIGTTWWIWNASAGGALMAFILNTLLMAIAFFVFHFIKKKVSKKSGFLFLPLTWIAFEYLHYYWELSWPWLSLGNTFSIRTTWIQWYEYTGSLGGTLWVLAVNLLVTSLIINYFFKKQTLKTLQKMLLGLTLILVLPILLSIYLYTSYEEEKRPIEVVLLQPNIDPYNEKFTASLESQLDKIFDLADTKVTNKTSIVIAPETAISWSFYEEDLKRLPFYPNLLKRKSNWNNAAFLTGASTVRFFETKHSRASRPMNGGPGFIERYNSSLLLDETNQSSFLHKSKLVLGVEKLPFSDWLPFLEELSIENGGTSGTLGIEEEPQVLHTDKFVFAPLICYESIYGEFNSEQVKKGAEVIFVITNDGWWGDTPGYKQHMSFSRIRAIENRRSVARSANTGTSCIINQRGDILQQTEYWKQDVLKGNVNLNKNITLYSATGDVLGKTFTIMASLLLLLSLVKYFVPSKGK
jgi:apolipoprotein N-acyltransferase